MKLLTTTTIIGMFTLLIGFGGCDSMDPTVDDGVGASMSYAPLPSGKADSSQQVCGGIAGFQCPDGMKCLMKETYPDAMGVCVGAETHDKWQVDCSLVRCAYPNCPEGFEVFFKGPKDCCGSCRPSNDKPVADGQCKQPSDCEGLIHIMCVGYWSCDNGWCNYQCGTPIDDQCQVIGLCIEGYSWDPVACDCVADKPMGVTCGPTVCEAGDVCCNESCGICTEPGGFCTEQYCLPM